MEVRININKALCICMLFYTMSALSYTIIESYISLSRIFGVLVLLFFFLITFRRINKKEIIVLIVSIGLLLVQCVIQGELRTNINDGLYWISTLLGLIILCKKDACQEIYNFYEQQHRFCWIFCTLCNGILLLAFFTPSCYVYTWGSRSFTGFAVSNHVLASSACLLLCITLISTRRMKSDFIKLLFMIPGTIAILASAARTYLISLIIIWFFFFFYRVKSKNYKTACLPLLLIACYFGFINSAIYEKILNPNTYVNTSGLEKLTAGRTVFWLIDIKKYMELNLIYKLIGHGFNYPYYVNEQFYGMRIWSHNDYINLLLSVGCIGCLIYVFTFFKAMKQLKNKKIYYIFVFTYFMFVSFVNGLFSYQHYLYSFLLLFIFVDVELRNKGNLIIKCKS